MKQPRPLRRTLLLGASTTFLLVNHVALAHDFRAGDLTIDHPYALPTPPVAKTGAVYFRGIGNRGHTADRLIGARADLATRIEIHESVTQNDIARMRERASIELPPGQTVQLRHGQGHHLMLIGLKAPLVAGERFDVTLRFERAGETTVQVWVQQPGGGTGGGHDHGEHKH